MPFPALSHYLAATGARSGLVRAEEQGSDYEAAVADLDGADWRVRTARITPTKPGAFVAVWRRDPSGATEPFDIGDSTAGLLVLVPAASRFGAFRFPLDRLGELGVYSTPTSSGKRGFRLYPPWCSDLNPQARRTQEKQAPFFDVLPPMPDLA